MKKNTINNMTKLASKMPKTLNEALNFNDNDMYEGDDMNSVENKVESPEIGNDIHPEEENLNGNEAEKARKLIDNIRKQALRAMASLADTPQSPEYENLKRIWQLCDKAVNEKEQEQQILNKQNGLQ